MGRRVAGVAAVLMIILVCAGCGGPPPPIPPDVGIPGGWTFVVEGDSRPVSLDSWRVSRRLLGMVARLPQQPEFIVDCGDLINSPGSRWQWWLFRRQMSLLPPGVPFYPVAGNHDVKDQSSQDMFREVFHLPPGGTYYSFGRNGAHFVVLDTEIPGQINSIGEDQARWLEKDLGAVPFTVPVFVFLHRPLFPQSGYAKEPLRNNESIHALLASRGVRAVFAGHEHFYNRMQRDGIFYIITGGGGSHLIRSTPGSFHHIIAVSVKGQSIRIQAVDAEGRLRDDVREDAQGNLH